jgi:putative ABC transport system permease protein
MLKEIILQAWDSLRRNPTRSLLTMLGIVWGIAAVTLLMAYGTGFRAVMMRTFNNFSKSALIVFPGQTSMQAGGERAGRRIRFELTDIEPVKADAPLVKEICPELVQRPVVSYRDKSFSLQVRAVCAEYGEIRSEIPIQGRWLSKDDEVERRRVVFLGDYSRKKLFGGRPPVGETIAIQGLRFTVVGYMDRKLSFGNYYGPDDRAMFIPYTTAGDMWNTRYPGNLVVQPVSALFETQALEQFRAAMARRKGFDPADKRALEAFGTTDIRPIIEGITTGLEWLLLLIGMLTLGIGGVGLMNILLVSVSERTREIGLRRALGARRWHIAWQFLSEALALTAAGGLLGIALSYGIEALMPPMPMLGAIFNDTTGKGDLVLAIRFKTVATSAAVLLLIGVAGGMVPALRAVRLDPVEALRTE